MKLVTFLAAGVAPRVGAIHNDAVVDLAAAHNLQAAERDRNAFPSSMIDLLRAEAQGMDLAAQALAFAAAEGAALVPIDDIRLLAPLPRPNSLRDFMLDEEHASGGERGRVRGRVIPAEWYRLPAYWKGNPDTIYGPFDEIPWPRYTEALDYELEIGLVIGRRGRDISADRASSYFAGYTIFNDWSARDIQRREMTVNLGPSLGKDFATSLGPCIVTPDEFDPLAATMRAKINGVVWGKADAQLTMQFTWPEVLEYISQAQELIPGDVLGSGTVGQGSGIELDQWLQPGDVLSLEVDGLGILTNTVGAKPSHASLAEPAPLRPAT